MRDEYLVTPASAITRAAIWTPIPAMSDHASRSLPCGGRHGSPPESVHAVSQASAERIARAGPSKVATRPSPVKSAMTPPCASIFVREISSSSRELLASHDRQAVLARRRVDDVGEQHRCQDSIGVMRGPSSNSRTPQPRRSRDLRHRRRSVIGIRHLHEHGSGDQYGHGRPHPERAGGHARHDEGRHPDRGEDRATSRSKIIRTTAAATEGLAASGGSGPRRRRTFRPPRWSD